MKSWWNKDQQDGVLDSLGTLFCLWKHRYGSTCLASLLHVPSWGLHQAPGNTVSPGISLHLWLFIVYPWHAIPSASKMIPGPSIPGCYGLNVLMGPCSTMGWCVELQLEDELGRECWSVEEGGETTCFLPRCSQQLRHKERVLQTRRALTWYPATTSWETGCWFNYSSVMLCSRQLKLRHWLRQQFQPYMEMVFLTEPVGATHMINYQLSTSQVFCDVLYTASNLQLMKASRLSSTCFGMTVLKVGKVYSV